MNSRPLRILLVVAAGAWVALGASCKPKGDAAPEKSQITIGGTLPLTGSEARVGGFFKEGYDLAMDELQKRGGLKVAGKTIPVTLNVLDDTSTAQTAVSLADRLVTSDKVDFFLGTYGTSLVEPQSRIAEQNQIPYITGGGAATAIWSKGYKWIFGTLAPVELLGKTLMVWIDEQQKAGKLPNAAKIALVWENTSHGKDFKKGVSDFVAKSNGAFTIVVDESFELNGKDFSALLGKVKDAGADIFLADAHLPDYITMHRQYVGAGLCHKVVSYGARGSEKAAIDALGKENTDYVLSGVWWNAQLALKTPLAKAFVEAFKAKFGGREPEWYQALAYETARTLFVAIEKAGTLDKEAVRAELAKLKIESLLPGGTLELPEATGHQAQNVFIVQQNLPDKGSPIVYPKDIATAEGIAPNPHCK